MIGSMPANPMFDIPLTVVGQPGVAVSLRELAGAQPVHVVLLRHLNCPFCQVRLGEIIRRRDEVGRVIVVSYSDPESALEYGLELPTGVVLACDEPRNLYVAAKCGRGSLWNVLLRPRILGKLAYFTMRGMKTLLPREDAFQLGADLVFDVHGRLVMKHVSRAADDHPPVDMIIAAMNVARSGIAAEAA